MLFKTCRYNFVPLILFIRRNLTADPFKTFAKKNDECPSVWDFKMRGANIGSLERPVKVRFPEKFNCGFPEKLLFV